MCFGAAVMAGVREIRYGAADRWAGAAGLVQASPYIAAKGMRVLGPQPLVQAVSLVLMTEYTLRRASARAAEVAAAFRAQDARATELGETWLRSGRLLRASRNAMPVARLCREIWQEIAAGYAIG